MPPADPSDAGTSSRRPDSIAPRRSLSSSAGTPGPTSWTGSATAWPSPGDSSRARPVPWPSWGSGDEEGRGHRRGDDPLPPAVAGDRQRDVLRGHEDGPRFRGPHPGGRGHGRERDRAGRLRRRPHEGRVPRGRLRRLPEAVYPGLHRRGDRSLQHDRGMVACRLRPRGRRPRRERGEDVLVPAAPAERVRAHLDPILDRPLKPNLVWIFAMEMNRYMHVHGVKKEDIARVAVKNKRNAVGHPCAQLADPNITVDDVLASEVMAWPVQRLDISPPSDGASAVVLASEDFIRRRKIKDRAWISGVGWCIDSTMWTDRDLYFPEYVARAAKQAYKMAKISDPRRQIDFAEPYDPFDYKELHHLEGLLLAKKGEAPILTREGVTERDGDLPVCPSGGLMGVGNPIAATMGQKIGELFWQLTNQAGKRQIPHEVHTGVAQAWGDLMQYGSVVVMSS